MSVWFDRGELRRFRRKRELPHQGSRRLRTAWIRKGTRTLVCPRCDTHTLQFGRVRSVGVLLCETCEGLYVSREAAERSHLIMQRMSARMRGIADELAQEGRPNLSALFRLLAYLFP